MLDQLREEVRLQRAAGRMDVSYERWMDHVFARLAPGSSEAGSFDDALEEAEGASMIDAEVPVSSRLPAGRFVKRVLRKAISWYMRFVVQQVRQSTQAIMRVLHMMDERLGGVEGSMVDLSARVEAVAAGVPRMATVVSPSWRGRPDLFLDVVADAISSGSLDARRVLHAECGAGEIVSHLRARGIDAYGIDSSWVPDVMGDHAVTGEVLDLRLGSVIDHLSGLADGGLGGVLLSGCVDWMTADEDLQLIRLCARKVSAGGVVAVVGTQPSAWWRSASRIVVDLARGRPLHPETWEELLRKSGGIGSLVFVEAGTGDVDAAAGDVAAMKPRSGLDAEDAEELSAAVEPPGEAPPVRESFLVMGRIVG